MVEKIERLFKIYCLGIPVPIFYKMLFDDHLEYFKRGEEHVFTRRESDTIKRCWFDKDGNALMGVSHDSVFFMSKKYKVFIEGLMTSYIDVELSHEERLDSLNAFLYLDESNLAFQIGKYLDIKFSYVSMPLAPHTNFFKKLEEKYSEKKI